MSYLITITCLNDDVDLWALQASSVDCVLILQYRIGELKDLTPQLASSPFSILFNHDPLGFTTPDQDKENVNESNSGYHLRHRKPGPSILQVLNIHSIYFLIWCQGFLWKWQVKYLTLSIHCLYTVIKFLVLESCGGFHYAVNSRSSVGADHPLCNFTLGRQIGPN